MIFKFFLILHLLFLFPLKVSWGVEGCRETNQEMHIGIDVLKQGGYVVFFRHTERNSAARTPGPLSDIDNDGECIDGTVLTENGIVQSEMIREKIKKENIIISDYISSPTCRTRQMASILSEGDDFEISRSLIYGTMRFPHEIPALREELYRIFDRPIPEGSNRILTSHGRVLDLIDFITPWLCQGDALVFKPLSFGHYKFIGIIRLREWN